MTNQMVYISPSTAVNLGYAKFQSAIESGQNINFLLQSLGYLQMAANDPDVNHQDVLHLYGVCAVICSLIGEIDSSYDFQTLANLYNPKDHRIKIASVFCLMAKDDDILVAENESSIKFSDRILRRKPKVEDENRLFLEPARLTYEYYQGKDWTRLNSRNRLYKEMICDARLIFLIAKKMWYLNIKDVRICELLYSLPWDKFQIETVKDENIPRAINDFHAEIYSLLALA